jgi:hypothetical protein
MTYDEEQEAMTEAVLQAARRFPGQELQFVKALPVALNLYVDQFVNWPVDDSHSSKRRLV